jgi:hypothetical protein
VVSMVLLTTHSPHSLSAIWTTSLKAGAQRSYAPIPIVSIWTSDSLAAPNFSELRQGEVRLSLGPMVQEAPKGIKALVFV